MANKITKRQVINAMLNDEVIKENEMYVNFLTHELELLDKKSARRTPTKTQKENEDLKAVILETLGSIGSGTVSEIMATNDTLGTLSNQKVTALLRQLVNAETVKKGTDEKRRSIFSLAA